MMNRTLLGDGQVFMRFWITDACHSTRKNFHVAHLLVSPAFRSEIVQHDDWILGRQRLVHQVSTVEFLAGDFFHKGFYDRV